MVSTISVELSELGPLAGQLDACADRYEQVGSTLLTLTAQVGALASLDLSGNGGMAAATLGASGGGLALLVAGMRKLAHGVRRSAAHYEAAEAYALEVLGRFEAAASVGKVAQKTFESAFGYVAGSLAITVSGRKVLVTSVTKDPLGALRSTPQGRSLLTEGTRSVSTVAQRAGLAGPLRATQDMTPRIDPDYRVDYLDPSKSIPQGPAGRFSSSPPLTLQAVTELIRTATQVENQADKANLAAGLIGEWDHVVVQTLENEVTGEIQYLVVIPGTDGDPLRPGDYYSGGTNTWGGAATSAVGALEDGAPTALMSQVEKALERAGAPQGAEVSLMGFSQGGLAAASLAAHPGFTSRYRVKGLVTQGSPIDHIKPVDGVKHIDLRYSGDHVPKLQPARSDYAPHHSHTFHTKPSEAKSHGADDYAAMAELDPQAVETHSGLQELFANHTVSDTLVIGGTTHRPDVLVSEQEQMALIGAANALNGAGQDVEAGHPLIQSQNLNMIDFYQDTDELLRSFDDKIIKPADEWLDRQLRKVEIGGVQLYNPVITLPGLEGEKPPTLPAATRIEVYPASSQDHIENLMKVVGVDELTPEGLAEGVAKQQRGLFDRLHPHRAPSPVQVYAG